MMVQDKSSNHSTCARIEDRGAFAGEVRQQTGRVVIEDVFARKPFDDERVGVVPTW